MRAAATLLLFVAVSTAAEVRHARGYLRSPPLANDAANLGVVNITAAEIAAAPDSIDWTAKGATTAVKDQGDCGSCWAFSTVETVESAVFMSTGKLPPPLSTQQVVACDRKSDDGCNGGDPPTAVRYLKKAGGIDTDSDYPDTSSKKGKTGKCKWDQKSVVTVSGFQYAVKPCENGKHCPADEDTLAAAVAKYGPLSVCVNSGDGSKADWDKYKGGVLEPKCAANPNKMDHCVQLVGYDKTASTPYWKVRNSWNTDWGEKGFIRLPMGQNACCIGCEATIISATSK